MARITYEINPVTDQVLVTCSECTEWKAVVHTPDGEVPATLRGWAKEHVLTHGPQFDEIVMDDGIEIPL